jgi:hypothetical protein
MEKEKLIQLGEIARTEDAQVEFKSKFAPEEKAAFWAEIVKDIVALANTNGGVIVFGINDDCSAAAFDCQSLESFDPAKITDQIAKYTDIQFHDFFIFSAVRLEGTFPAIGVYPRRLPIVFTKVGTYNIGTKDKQVQKTAFSQGTLYFRHGAKSEPANQDDVRDAFFRELTRDRQEMLKNLSQVVEAGPGTRVIVADATSPTSDVRLTSDPSAPEIRVRDLRDTHPYRQGEAISAIRKKLERSVKLNSHDFICIKFAEKISAQSRPDLIHMPHEKASPQYSEQFVELVANKLAANENYQADCRAAFKAHQRKVNS